MKIKQLAPNVVGEVRVERVNSSQKSRIGRENKVIPGAVLVRLEEMSTISAGEYGKSIVQLAIENGLNPDTLTKRLYRMRLRKGVISRGPIKDNYTKDDLNVLFQEVSNTPYNLRNAFSNTAIRLKRNPAAIASKWYDLKRSGLIPKFALGSPVGATSNTKNVCRVDGIMPEVTTRPVLTVVALMLELSEEQRVAVLTIFK